MFELAIGIGLGVLGFMILKVVFKDVLEIDNKVNYENKYKIPSRFRNPSKNSSN